MFRISKCQGIWGLAILLAAGCSSEELGELVEQVKETAQETTQQVQESVEETTQEVKQAVQETTTEMKETLNLAGKIELTLGEPLTTDACYAVFTPPSNYPGLLQLKSYRTPEQEEFPSIFAQAQVTASDLSELVGQVVSARVFVQRESGGPVWSCEAASPCELKVVSLEESLLVVEVVSGALRDAATRADTPLTGKLTAIVE